MVTNLLTHGLPTIAAIATPRGVGGVAIIRVSGDHAYMVADAIVRTSGKPPSLRSPNTFFHARLATPADTHFIDDALVLCFHAPRSYTGEDVVEFHGHGGAAVSARVLQAALDAGAQPAAPGEFSISPRNLASLR